MKGLDGKLSFADNFALYHLCMSDIRWNTHDSGTTQTKDTLFFGYNTLYGRLLYICKRLEFELIAVAPIVLACMGVLYLLMILGSGEFLKRIPFLIVIFGSAYLLFYLYQRPLLFVHTPVFWNLLDEDKVRFNVNYFESAWYKNTGIMPQQITADSRRGNNRKGIYGEYIATLAIERNMERNKLKGSVFNNVIVPNENILFTKIDIVAVTSAGILVIDATDKIGKFIGDMCEPDWTQQINNREHEMKNPLVQNIGHVNALRQYLYDQAEDTGSYKELDLIKAFANIVAFSSLEADFSGLTGTAPINSLLLLSQTHTHTIGTALFSGLLNLLRGKREEEMPVGYHKSFNKMNCGLASYDFIEWENGKVLTDEEINEIVDIMEAMPSYTAEQREKMFHDRKTKMEAGILNNPSYYTVVSVMMPSGVEKEKNEFTMVMRSCGKEKAFRSEDGQFYTIPNATLTAYLAVDKYTDDIRIVTRENPKRQSEQIYWLESKEEAERLLHKVL